MKKLLATAVLAALPFTAMANDMAEMIDRKIDEIAIMTFETCSSSKRLQDNFEIQVRLGGRNEESRAHLFRLFALGQDREIMMLVIDVLWATFEPEEELQKVVGTTERREAAYQFCMERKATNLFADNVTKERRELFDRLKKLNLI